MATKYILWKENKDVKREIQSAGNSKEVYVTRREKTESSVKETKPHGFSLYNNNLK